MESAQTACQSYKRTYLSIGESVVFPWFQYRDHADVFFQWPGALASVCFLSFRETYQEPIQRDVWLRGIAGLGTPDGFLYLRAVGEIGFTCRSNLLSEHFSLCRFRQMICRLKLSLRVAICSLTKIIRELLDLIRFKVHFIQVAYMD